MGVQEEDMAHDSGHAEIFITAFKFERFRSEADRGSMALWDMAYGTMRIWEHSLLILIHPQYQFSKKKMRERKQGLSMNRLHNRS